MPAAINVNSTRIWPTLGETLADLSRERTLTRETLGTSAIARTLDRANGMVRTGAADNAQTLYGGIVAGKNMDWAANGNVVPRDAFSQTDDLMRGLQTLHMGSGRLLNTSA